MTVTVDAVIFFEIIDAEQALCAVDDYRYNPQRRQKKRLIVFDVRSLAEC